MKWKLINEEWLDREINKSRPKGYHEGPAHALDALLGVKKQLKDISILPNSEQSVQASVATEAEQRTEP